jgi:hypothetical protein
LIALAAQRAACEGAEELGVEGLALEVTRQAEGEAPQRGSGPSNVRIAQSVIDLLEGVAAQLPPSEQVSAAMVADALNTLG